MRDEPIGLPRPLLAQALRTHWGIDVQRLDYAPVGAGSYHWVAEEGSGPRWFITADNLESLPTQDGRDAEDNFAGLQAAYLTATALRETGLAFVLAPNRANDGQVVLRVLPNWAVAVFAFIEGQVSGRGQWTDPSQQAAAAELIGQLHGLRPPPMIRRWDFVIPYRGVLVEALDDLGRSWLAGPYGESARELLASSRPDVEALLAHYDRLAKVVASLRDLWVVTHGEPHSANFLSGPRGEMYLIDWDTVRLAPRERDLEIVVGGDPNALAAYQASAGPYGPRSEALELFRARWTLADLCLFIRPFRRPHSGSLDDEKSWNGLTHYLPVESDWPALG